MSSGQVITTSGLLLTAALAVALVPERHRLTLWVLVIIAIVVPWSIQTHTHWDRVQWVPFVSPPVRARDIIGNVALYVPFGLFCARRARVTLLAGIGWALLLSLGTEASQLYSHGRFPSVQDVLMNVAGVAIGIVAASHIHFRGVGTPHRHLILID